MATVNLGRIKPVFRGAYSGSTAYVVDDIVTSGGSSYICIQAHGAGTQAVNQTAYWTQMAAGGTDVGTTITTQGDLLYRDGSGLQRLAKGTASQVLKMNTAANAPEWGNLSSDYVKLGEATCTGASDLHVDLFSADYDYYQVFIHQMHSSSTGYNFKLQFNTAANTPQTGGNYRYIFDGWYWNSSDANSAQRTGGWNNAQIEMSPLPDTADNANSHILTFFRPYSASTRTSVTASTNGHENNHIYSRHGQGYYNGNEQHTGFTITSGSGTITIPSLKVYGLK